MDFNKTHPNILWATLFSILLATMCQTSALNSADYYKAEKDLIDKLMLNYNPNIRPKPVVNGTWDSENFNIYLALSLNAVMDLDELEETMSTSMIFTMLWFDEHLMWNPADHMNISQIYLKTSEVWKPNWFVANSVERESDTASSKEWVPIHIQSDGRALWQDQLPLKTSCDVDTTFYPFDKQRCSVYLHWYEYEIAIVSIKEDVHLKTYRTNDLWDLFNYTISSEKEGYPDFNLTYFFSRKPGHTVYNLLFPVIIIALLGPLVFLLPAESGERTGYIITVLLAVSVYMTIISDQLPRKSNPMSLLTYVLFAWYLLSALIVVVVVICSKMYSFDSSKPVPRVLQCIVKCCRCGKKGVKRNSTRRENGGEESETSPCVVNGHGNAVDGASDSKADGDVTWASVGRAIDRAALVIFYTLKMHAGTPYLAIVSHNRHVTPPCPDGFSKYCNKNWNF